MRTGFSVAGRYISFRVRVIISLATGSYEWSECRSAVNWLKIKTWLLLFKMSPNGKILKTYRHSVSVFRLKPCAAFVHKCQKHKRILETTWIIYFGLNQWIQKHLGLDDSAKPQEVFTNALSTRRDGILEICFPKLGKNREGETPKWSEQVLKSTPGLCGPQPAALNSSEAKHCRLITSHRWHISYRWLLTDNKSWHYTSCCKCLKKEDISDYRPQWVHLSPPTIQDKSQSPAFLYSPFLGCHKKLKRPLHQFSVPSSIWHVPYQQSCTPPL